jgi:predicted nucleic acid-binding protein
MSGFLLDTNIPSEIVRLQPEPRVTDWIAQANHALFLSLVTIGELKVCLLFAAL